MSDLQQQPRLKRARGEKSELKTTSDGSWSGSGQYAQLSSTTQEASKLNGTLRIEHECYHEPPPFNSRKRPYDGPGNDFPPPPDAIQDIGIIELLEQDSRPTFIFDIEAPEQEVNGRMTFVPAYCNKSLRFFDSIRNVVCAETFYAPVSEYTPSQVTSAAAEQEFREWAMTMPNFNSSKDGYLPRHQFLGMYWSSVTLRKKWRVVSASQVPSQLKKSHGTPRLIRSRSNSRSSVGSSTVRPSPISDAAPEDAIVDDEESELSKQLADSESKFKVLTELNPVGMYYLSPDGNILYCNDMCRYLLGEATSMN